MSFRAVFVVVSALVALACSEPTPATRSASGALTGERAQTQLVSPEPSEFARFGNAVAAFDDELWVGEPGAALGDELWVGRVWRYRWGGVWQVGDELRPQGSGGGQQFGTRLVVGERHVFVAAPGDGQGVPSTVQVFSRETGELQQVLDSDEPEFGRDLASAADRLLVGACGVAVLYRSSPSGWLAEQLLRPRNPEQHRDFGGRVALSETRAAIAGSNQDTFDAEVTLFEEQLDGAWLETKTITGIDTSSLAMDEERLFIGDTAVPSSFAGGVHVLSRAQDWQEVALLETTAATIDFGKALTLSGDTLTVLGQSAAALFTMQGAKAVESEHLWASPTLLYDGGLVSASSSPRALALGAPFVAAQNLDGAGSVLVLAQCEDDDACGAGRFCASSQRCESVLELATACERDAQCGSGHCADGVCCNSACVGSCEACAEPKSAGRCVAVNGAPRGERKACAGDGICGGSCSGVARGCSYPAAYTPCGGSCREGRETRSSCDGAGACRDEPEQSCGDYRCRDDACATTCTSRDDCRDGASCVSGTCVELSSAQCTKGRDSSVGPLGTRSCGAYRCDDASGACLSACSDSGQCASGYVCDATTRNCVSELPAPADSGCSCRAAGASASGSAAMLALLLAALLLLRRGRVRALGLGGLLLASSACQDAERAPPSVESQGQAAAALSQDAVWVPGSRLSGDTGFGSALAVSGSSLLVAGDYALEWLNRTGADWQRVQRIEPAELPGAGCFELRAELADDFALVSADGGARVFLRNEAGQFEEQARLQGVPEPPPSHGCFIAVNGRHVAVADYDRTYLLERSGARFEPVVSVPGRILALTTQAIVVAVHHEDTWTTDVDVYGPWGAEPKLLASLPQPPAPDGMLARAVADEHSLIVAETGRVMYAYDMTELAAKPAVLRPADDAEHHYFGSALALSGDLLLTGESPDLTAQVFRGSGRSFRSTFLLAGARDIYGRLGSFGYSVAIQDDELLVGDPRYALGTRGPFGVVFVHGRCSAGAPCGDGFFCAAEGFCAPAKRLGAACDSGAGRDCLVEGCSVCETGNCVDGVCCESRCGGQCEACAEPATPGKCVLIAGAPREPREPCLGTDDTCRGRCSGEAPACVYPTTNDACGSRCVDGRETPSTCNGRGDCLERGSRSCLGFGCGEAACSTSCEGDADCVTGFACLERSCVAVARAHTCSEDGTRSRTDEGEIPCGFYRCDKASGDCRQECTEASDCALGLVCDVPRKECVRERETPLAESGCGCRLGRAGAGAADAKPWLAFAMLCWLARRRRLCPLPWS